MLGEMRQYRGKHGVYAAEMLETARLLLWQLEQHPRQAEAAAYCIRQAVVEIFGDTKDYGALRDVARSVVDAKDGMQTTDTVNEEGFLKLHLAMENLKNLLCDQKPETRLKKIFTKSSGTEPVDGPHSFIREYRRTSNKSSRLMHRVSKTRTDVSKVRDHYDKVVDVLALIFLSRVRMHRIAQLAELPAPRKSDLDKLRRTMKHAYDFQYFAKKMSSPDWFDLMDADMLKSTSGRPPWLLRSLVWYLKDAHVDAFVRMLENNFDRWTSDDAGLGELGFVGYRLGDDGLPWLIKTLQASKRVRIERVEKMKTCPDASRTGPELSEEIGRTGGSIRHLDDCARRAFLKMNQPNSEFIELAEHLLSPDSTINDYNKTDTIPAKLVEAMDQKFAIRIVKILVREFLAKLGRYRYRIPRLGSLNGPGRNHLFGIDSLVASLQGALVKAGDLGIPTPNLIMELGSLSEAVRPRFEAWLYSRVDDVDFAEVVHYIIDSCNNRRPNDEDGLLLAKLKQDGRIQDISGQITSLLGRAPDTRKMSGDPRQWEISRDEVRHIRWASTMRPWVELPDEWKSCLDIVDGSHDAERDTGSGHAQKASGGQDETALPEGLDADDALEVAAKIASVNPSIDTFPELAGRQSLASYLETTVRRNTLRWAENPVGIIRALRHPEYVVSYFRGLTNTNADLAPYAARIVSAVKSARTLQWDDGASGSSIFYYDGTFLNVDMAGMGLIEKMIKGNIILGKDSLADVWSVVGEAVVLPDPETVAQPDYSIEYLHTVHDLPHVRAVHTLFEMFRYAKRNNTDVPNMILTRLAEAVRLTGQHGVDYRACIGPQANFMYVVAPEWFERNEQYLFGSAASTELGRVALDMCMIRYKPDAFILAKYQDGVLNAVKRSIPGALHHLLYGLLWGMSGYDPKHIAKKLMNIGPEYVSKAGGWDMYNLLREGAGAEHVQRAVDFWDSVLEQSPKPEALVGFGWYASVPGIAQERWEELMMRTCEMVEKLDWSQEVAERISTSETITDAGWRILTRLLSIDLGHEGEEVANHAMDALRRTAGIVDAPESRSRLRDALWDHGFHDAAEF